MNTSPTARGASIRLSAALLLIVLLSVSLQPSPLVSADVLTANEATAFVATTTLSSAAQPTATRQLSVTSPLTKQFEETSYYLKDVDFINADVGWAVGHPHWDQARRVYTGTILKTTDGGLTWNAQLADTLATLRNVDFVDAGHGWAVGTDGVILHTADGGAHWTQQVVDSADEFRGVAFASATQGWATSFHAVHTDSWGDPDDWRGSIWHTADGGAHWTRQSLPANASLLNRIKFIDAQLGWAVGIKFTGDDQFGYPQHTGVVYRTTNGGQIWEEFYSPGANITLTGVEWIDATHGWVVGFPNRSEVQGGFVFHTNDGGQTWQQQSPGGIFDPLWDVQFIDANRGYVVGFNYIAAAGPPVFRTLDGGDTWQKIILDEHDSEGLFALSIVDDLAIFLGDHDFIAYSTRAWDDFTPAPCIYGGCLFTPTYLNIHYIFHDVFFANATEGWAVGSRCYAPSVWGQVIFHTTNGGQTWASQYEQAPTPDAAFSYMRLDSVHFVDSLRGWAVGASETYSAGGRWEHHGAILHTADGGQNWQEQGQELYAQWDLEFFAVHFLDEHNGWALAANHFPSQNIQLAHTTDGGAHWNWVDTGIEGPIGIGFAFVQGDVLFTDAQHGWAVGGLSQVIKTEDGGAHWTRAALSCGLHPCRANVFAVALADDQHGWIVGEGAFRSSDGGAHWQYGEIGTRGWIQDIQFLDEGDGWLATTWGEMWFTDNGGERWRPLPLESSFALHGLHLLDAQHGWFVGDGGTILKLSADRWPVIEDLFLPLVK